jgi:hypothetical protein
MRAVGPDKRSGKQILVTLGAYPLPIRKSSKSLIEYKMSLKVRYDSNTR